jgi:hypothetical protein
LLDRSEQCSGKNKDLKKLAKHLGINGWQLARRLSGAKPFTIDELVEAAKWLEIPIGALLSATSLGQPRVM